MFLLKSLLPPLPEVPLQRCTLILSSDFKRKLSTTDDSGRATAYTLYYSIAYSVKDSDGVTLTPIEKVEQARELEYSAEQELQAEEEEDFLKETMRDEITLIIMSKLSRLGRASTVETTESEEISETVETPTE